MRGSLDKPPIVIRTARWKVLIVLLLCILFVALGVKMSAEEASRTGGYVTIVFFGLGVVASIWQLIRPQRLQLTPQGLVWFSIRKKLTYRWSDFEEFRPFHPSRFGTQIGYVLSEASSMHSRLGDWNKRMFGLDGSFGSGWELGPEELINLLNTALKRWRG